MRKEEEDLYMLRGMISSMSQDKQEKIKSVAEQLRTVITSADALDLASVALALVGLEIATGK